VNPQRKSTLNKHLNVTPRGRFGDAERHSEILAADGAVALQQRQGMTVPDGR
jgi:hypothetical protein